MPFRPALADRQAPAVEDAELVLAEHGWLQLAPVRSSWPTAAWSASSAGARRRWRWPRSLMCQAAVLQGPADVTVAVFTEAAGARRSGTGSSGCRTRDAAGRSGLQPAVGADRSAGTLASELGTEREADDGRVVLAVLDSPALIEGRGAAGRALLRSGERVSGIVLARSSERLPAACTTVIELADEAGEARLWRPQPGDRVDPLLVAGVSARTARECALALARFEDADLQLAAARCPSRRAARAARRARPERGRAPPAVAPAAVTISLGATFALDPRTGRSRSTSSRDGPHGLVAGTTGSGKSELLRSLVAALAAGNGPEQLNFVLIDYKGGSAFARSAPSCRTPSAWSPTSTSSSGERALREPRGRAAPSRAGAARASAPTICRR